MASRLSAAAVQRRTGALADPARAKASAWFFKTGPGQYGEGDRFLGIPVPALRTLAREFTPLSLPHISRLLASRWHEERLLAALILVRQYERGDASTQEAIYRLYLRSLDRINNWDIVDSSAPHIVGAHLDRRARPVLTRLARSSNLWSRRVAIIATQYSIRQRRFGDTVAIATLLLHDEHDLIHKAVGWMLREVGNRDETALRRFLDRFAGTMPRTMLRYAIEKLPPARRRRYLAV